MIKTNTTNIQKNEYAYIYNVKQADFYIQNGLVPESVDTHYTTKNVFFVFLKTDKLNNIFKKWVASGKNKQTLK